MLEAECIITSSLFGHLEQCVSTHVFGLTCCTQKLARVVTILSIQTCPAHAVYEIEFVKHMFVFQSRNQGVQPRICNIKTHKTHTPVGSVPPMQFLLALLQSSSLIRHGIHCSRSNILYHPFLLLIIFTCALVVVGEDDERERKTWYRMCGTAWFNKIPTLIRVPWYSSNGISSRSRSSLHTKSVFLPTVTSKSPRKQPHGNQESIYWPLSLEAFKLQTSASMKLCLI